MVNPLPSNAGGAGSVPVQGPKIPHALWSRGQNIDETNIVTNSIKDSKHHVFKKYTRSSLNWDMRFIRDPRVFFDLNFYPRIISVTSLIERSA